MASGLAVALLDALPQTQCRRCGYADCRAYAEAIADAGAPINRCPPGGAEGIARLARLTGRDLTALDLGCGPEGPRRRAVIDEAACIGCALCLKECPVDAIVGAAKQMHVVSAGLCTGCELCIPACPVDCIDLLGVSGAATGWAAWSAGDAAQARRRYGSHLARTTKAEPTRPVDAAAAPPAADALIAAAFARARSRQAER